MSLLLLYFPLLSACIHGVGGRWLGRKGSTILAPTLLGLTWLVAVGIAGSIFFAQEVWYTSLGTCVTRFSYLTNLRAATVAQVTTEFGHYAAANCDPCAEALATGREAGRKLMGDFTAAMLQASAELQGRVYELRWGLQYDRLTAVMILVVTTISGLVHLYATTYMSTDPHLPRFLACLSLFTFFMLVLVTADNYFQLFVGWEGVGLCSYLLINFWYTRVQANKAALQALVVNKVGDFFLALGVIFLLTTVSTTQFTTVFALGDVLSQMEVVVGIWSLPLLEVIGGCCLVAAVAKSAQIGLHTWLLSAMEGPTPVSALLHAATMVTAGVFLLLRSSPLLERAPGRLGWIAVVGAVTAFFAGTSGLVQHDLKKIIALSTCSQLGYMFYACGLSQYSLSLFHLTNHAFFKALLFLGAGAVIHALRGEQDLRRMGGLAQLMPVTYVAMRLASLALMGLPFLRGFYSKDRILEAAWATYSVVGHFNFWLTTAAAVCTAVYSWRLLYWVFLRDRQGYKTIVARVHEADERMLWTFRILMLGSLFTGYLAQDAFVGVGRTFFQDRLANSVTTFSALLEREFVPLYIKLLPFLGRVTGAALALAFYHSPAYSHLVRWQLRNDLGYALHFFLVKKWFFDRLYNYYIATRLFNFGWWLYAQADQGYLETVGPQGLARTISWGGTLVNRALRWSARVMLSNLWAGLALVAGFQFLLLGWR